MSANEHEAAHGAWKPPLPDPANLVVRYGDSIAEQFARGHTFSAILRELIQNEYDAAGSSVEVTLEPDALRVRGTGAVIGPDGWKRLSVVMGTGRVSGPEQEKVEPKKNGIGSKNFGLRSLFVVGDTIHIRSGGFTSVLDLRAGVDRSPRLDPESRGVPGVEIYVPYRTARSGLLEPFTAEAEELALESAAASLGPALLKLAVPGARKSVERLTLRSARLGRILEWSQRAALLRCRLRSIKTIRRTVRFMDSLLGERTEQEMEFSSTVRIPPDQRGRDIPDYYRRPGGRITISVSIATRRGRASAGVIGGWFYPIGVQGQSTGTAMSVSAPFEMNEDRTALVPTSGSTWNRWLLDEAVSLTMKLLTADWWPRFGADAFVAAWPTDLERTEEPRFAVTLRERMKREACWPAQAPRGAISFRPATELVVPETPALSGFLATERYAPDVALRCPGFAEALTQAGAKPFGLPSLVRLRCAGKDASQLSTRLNRGVADFSYDDFELALRNPDRQAQFAKALDTFHRLPESARADLAGTYSTLSAADSLEPARELQRVPEEIADPSVPARSRLHPCLLFSRTFQRLAQRYDPYQWARGVAIRAAKDASEEERVALYGFIRQKHGRFPASLLSALRTAPVLQDKDGIWAAPRELVLRRTPGRKEFGPVLRLPHSEIEADRELVRALRIRDRLAASDLVALAGWAAEDRSRAEPFERILLAQRRFWNSQTVRALSRIPFLRSRAGGLARPESLYVDSARLRSTVGEDASFVESSLPRSLLIRLECRTEPRSDDILAHLGSLRRAGAGPAAPETLYPELVAALHREHRSASELIAHPVLWTDAGWACPEDVVLRTGPVRFPPGSIPRPLFGSAEILEAYRRLGASPSPTERHWRYALRWLAAQHPSGDVIPRSHADLARAAYVHLGAAGGEFKSSDTILLGRDGRLYPIKAANRGRFVLDDHPRLAAAVEAASLPYAFADAAETNAIRFFQAVGVRALSGIAGSPRWKVGADRPPPARLRVQTALARLHHPAFPSALAAFVAQRVLRTGRGRELGVPTIGRRLARIEQLRFVQELAAVYRVGGKTVEVPSRIHVVGTEVLLSGVRSEAGVLSALAQMIARDLPGNDPVEWADAVLGLLQCDDPDEMREYLADRDISWTPPAAARQAAPPRDELSAALAEQLGFEVPAQADPPEEPGPRPSGSVAPSPRPAQPPPLPPLKDVQPIWEAATEAVIAERSLGSGGGGHGGGGTLPRDEVQDRRIGYRGEELVYLHERARVRAAGLPEDSVVWVARDNPMADHDIRSVGEEGQTIWIEVKATTGRDGRFRWSRAEINLATRKREQYLLYRVYEADSIHPRIKMFPNPASLFLAGRLRLDVAVLQAEVEGVG